MVVLALELDATEQCEALEGGVHAGLLAQFPARRVGERLLAVDFPAREDPHVDGVVTHQE